MDSGPEISQLSFVHWSVKVFWRDRHASQQPGGALAYVLGLHGYHRARSGLAVAQHQQQAPNAIMTHAATMPFNRQSKHACESEGGQDARKPDHQVSERPQRHAGNIVAFMCSRAKQHSFPWVSKRSCSEAALEPPVRLI